MLAEDRFAEELRKAIRARLRCERSAPAYLAATGMPILGETARASGLRRFDAGLGKHELVEEEYAIREGILRAGNIEERLTARLASPTNDDQC